MQNQQLLEAMNHEITVTASGDSLEDTVGKLFQVMRKQIFSEVDKPIIQMEAEEVYFETVKTEHRTEKFMLFFWPRERVSYTITARIIVKVKYLNVTKEDF